MYLPQLKTEKITKNTWHLSTGFIGEPSAHLKSAAKLFMLAKGPYIHVLILFKSNTKNTSSNLP